MVRREILKDESVAIVVRAVKEIPADIHLIDIVVVVDRGRRNRLTR